MLKAQAVDHEQLGLDDAFRVCRLGFEFMRVFVRADQGADVHTVATHHAHQVAQDAEAGDYGDFVGGIAGGAEHGGGQGDEQFADDVLHRNLGLE